MIDIRKLVDVNIVDKTMVSTATSRDTMVLFTTDNLAADAKANFFNLFSSLDEFNQAYPVEDPDANYGQTRRYLRIFFDNGGIKVKCIKVASDITAANMLATINALPKQYIVIGFVQPLYSILEDVANSANWTGIDKKILLKGTAAIPEREVFPNFLVEKYEKYPAAGFEMAIGAYLTQVNVDGTNTVEDYCFTKETLWHEESPIEIDDTTFDALQEQNVNFNIVLANSNRNIGGNMLNGLDLVNEYCLIVCQQDITTAVLNALLRKLKGESGLAAIRTAITEVLQKYVTNGYLTTEKIWEDRDYKVTVNGKDYTIVEANTPISKGFIVKILPLSSLTNDEKLERKTPKIYVVLADMYGFRKVEINGEVY